MYIYLRVVKPPNPTKQMLLGEAGLGQLWQAFDTTTGASMTLTEEVYTPIPNQFLAPISVPSNPA